jgi:hypothetical protein
MFVRSRLMKGVRYSQLIEGYRDEDGMVCHRTIASLGRSPTIEGAIEQSKATIAECKRQKELGTFAWYDRRFDRRIDEATAKLARLQAIPTVDTTPDALGSPAGDTDCCVNGRDPEG